MHLPTGTGMAAVAPADARPPARSWSARASLQIVKGSYPPVPSTRSKVGQLQGRSEAGRQGGGPTSFPPASQPGVQRGSRLVHSKQLGRYRKS